MFPLRGAFRNSMMCMKPFSIGALSLSTFNSLMLAASKRGLVRLESLRQAGSFESKNNAQDFPFLNHNSLKES